MTPGKPLDMDPYTVVAPPQQLANPYMYMLSTRTPRQRFTQEVLPYYRAFERILPRGTTVHDFVKAMRETLRRELT